ncbi:hypothetical protein ACHQM5_011216 [Ranunculus cassubicifolius]
MAESSSSQSQSKSYDSESSKSISDDEQTSKNQPITEYEKKRLERIKENKSRMEALKLSTLSSSLINSSEKKKNKGKKKAKIGKNKEDDDEYQPSDCEDRVCSSSEEAENSKDDMDTAPNYAHKGKTKQSLKKCNQKKKPSAHKLVRKLDFMDDDEALQQAIALSLEDSLDISRGVHEHAQKRRPDASDVRTQENKRGAGATEETDKRKKTRRLNMSSRLQITEDQVVIHFFQFDEAGKGGITLKDLKRVAVDHDFSWSDDEMADMIHFFDNGGDGKLNLDDFRKILHRCSMIKE